MLCSCVTIVLTTFCGFPYDGFSYRLCVIWPISECLLTCQLTFNWWTVIKFGYLYKTWLPFYRCLLAGHVKNLRIYICPCNLVCIVGSHMVFTRLLKQSVQSAIYHENEVSNSYNFNSKIPNLSVSKSRTRVFKRWWTGLSLNLGGYQWKQWWFHKLSNFKLSVMHLGGSQVAHSY